MFRQRLMSFMYGRNGADSLSFGLLVVSVLIGIISRFMRFSPTLYLLFYFLEAAVLVFMMFRMLSRNIVRRRMENEWFERNILSKLKFGSKSQNGYGSYNTYDYRTTVQEDKVNYKYFKCKGCSSKLRVPKGKGRLTVTCPKCKASFKVKS